MNRRWLIALGAVLALLAGLFAAGTWLRSHPAARSASSVQATPGIVSYLEIQAAALRPEFAGDLEALADAPRYTIAATIDPQARMVTGQLEVAFTNPGEQEISRLVFRLLPNAGSIYGGGSLAVESTTMDGVPLSTVLAQQDTVLNVDLPEPLLPGETVTVDLDFSAEVPAGLSRGYGIFNQVGSVTTLAGWYPLLTAYAKDWQAPPIPQVGDALLADTSFYQVELVVPEGYTLVTTGTVIATQPVSGPLPGARGAEGEGPGPANTTSSSEEWIAWQVVSGPVREFAAVLSPDFQQRETEVGGVNLRIFTLPAEDPVTSPEAGLRMMADMFQAFTDRFGPYPYTELDLVETAITIGGYEFSGMVYVDDQLRTNAARSRYEYLLAHELAHQWWYGLVGNYTIRQPWMDEAHATYGAVLYLEHAGRPAAGQRLLANWEQSEVLRQPGHGPVNSPALDFSDWGVYRETVYTQGALFLAELRQQIGDERFFELLQRAQAEHRYGRLDTAEYLALAEEVAGENLDELYERFFERE